MQNQPPKHTDASANLNKEPSQLKATAAQMPVAEVKAQQPQAEVTAKVEIPAPQPKQEPVHTVSGNRAIGQEMAAAKGWTGDQWRCLERLWTGESNWNHNAHNRSSGAHGIVQSLPASKMASHGADYLTNPRTQIAWGLDYISARYKTPCAALSFWNSKLPHWY